MTDHLYKVTVWPVTEPSESTYEPIDLEVPANASAEQAMSHVQKMLLDDPLEFVPIPNKLFIAIERSDGDTCHASMSIEYGEDDE